MTFAHPCTVYTEWCVSKWNTKQSTIGDCIDRPFHFIYFFLVLLYSFIFFSFSSNDLFSNSETYSCFDSWLQGVPNLMLSFFVTRSYSSILNLLFCESPSRISFVLVVPSRLVQYFDLILVNLFDCASLAFLFYTTLSQIVFSVFSWSQVFFLLSRVSEFFCNFAAKV